MLLFLLVLSAERKKGGLARGREVVKYLG